MRATRSAIWDNDPIMKYSPYRIENTSQADEMAGAHQRVRWSVGLPGRQRQNLNGLTNPEPTAAARSRPLPRRR